MSDAFERFVRSREMTWAAVWAWGGSQRRCLDTRLCLRALRSAVPQSDDRLGQCLFRVRRCLRHIAIVYSVT